MIPTCLIVSASALCPCIASAMGMRTQHSPWVNDAISRPQRLSCRAPVMLRLAALVLALCAVAALAAESATVECSAQGCRVNRKIGASAVEIHGPQSSPSLTLPPVGTAPLPAASAGRSGAVSVRGSGSLLWNATQPILIYDTVAIAANGSIAAFTFVSRTQSSHPPCSVLLRCPPTVRTDPLLLPQPRQQRGGPRHAPGGRLRHRQEALGQH